MRKLLPDWPDLGATMRPRDAAELFTFKSVRSLNRLRKNGDLMRGVHWQSDPSGRHVIYFKRACTHYVQNMGSPQDHKKWITDVLFAGN